MALTTTERNILWGVGIFALLFTFWILAINWNDWFGDWRNAPGAAAAVIPTIASPSVLPTWAWWVIGIVVIGTLIGWWTNWLNRPSGLNTYNPPWINLLLIACAVTFILKALDNHARLRTGVLTAYYSSVANTAIWMSIVGMLLVIFLLKDIPRGIPVRKILAFIIALMISFMLIDLFFPNLPLERLWEANWQNILIGAGVILLVILMLAFDKQVWNIIKAAAVIAAIFFLGHWLWNMDIASANTSSSPPSQAEKKEDLRQKIKVTPGHLTRVEWKYPSYRYQEFAPGIEGSRPVTLICFIQDHEPTEKDPRFPIPPGAKLEPPPDDPQWRKRAKNKKPIWFAVAPSNIKIDEDEGIQFELEYRNEKLN